MFRRNGQHIWFAIYINLMKLMISVLIGINGAFIIHNYRIYLDETEIQERISTREEAFFLQVSEHELETLRLIYKQDMNFLCRDIAVDYMEMIYKTVIEGVQTKEILSKNFILRYFDITDKLGESFSSLGCHSSDALILIVRKKEIESMISDMVNDSKQGV